MSATCAKGECENPPAIGASGESRKYCSPACRYTDAALRNQMIEARNRTHVMSDVDPKTLRGTCSSCGPVRVRVRSDGSKRHSDLITYRCVQQERVRVWARKYGLTADEVFDMRDAQDNQCAICSIEFDPESLRKNFYIDHDHKTGKVRALLCNGCNTGLGLFRDDPDLLVLAIAYLEQHKKGSP